MISQSTRDHESSQIQVQIQPPQQWAGYSSADSFQQSSPIPPSFFYDMSTFSSLMPPNANYIQSISVHSSVANAIDIENIAGMSMNPNVIPLPTAPNPNNAQLFMNLANVANTIHQQSNIYQRRIPSMISSANSSVGNSSNIDLQSLQNALDIHTLQVPNMIDINVLPVQHQSQSATTVDANIARYQTPPRSAPVHTQLQSFANFHPIIVDHQYNDTYEQYPIPINMQTYPQYLPMDAYNNTYYDFESFVDTFTPEHTSPNAKVTHLICADGQSIPLNKNNGYYDHSSFDANADPFTISDDVLFRGLLSTIIYIEWQTSPEFASIRVHSDNRIMHVPLCDLQRIENIKVSNAPPPGIIPEIPLHLRRKQLDNGSIRRSIKLNDESLMKLPHLRKHREYLKTIDINLGPKDYNSYRVSVNSQKVNEKTVENKNKNGYRVRNGNYNQHSHNLSKRADVPFEKSNLFKTELCENFMKRGRCTYGTKCHFAHGRHDIRNRWRIENYKTQPCCDPARAQSRLCLFGKRCNYAHPGEPLRRPMPEIYLDEEYTEKIVDDYGFKHPFPFGIYI